jgi:hypothetical protein
LAVGKKNEARANLSGRIDLFAKETAKRNNFDGNGSIEWVVFFAGRRFPCRQNIVRVSIHHEKGNERGIDVANTADSVQTPGCLSKREVINDVVTLPSNCRINT